MKLHRMSAITALIYFTAVSAAMALSTKDFVQKASVANEFEIESSKLALDKSQNKDIKRFAQHMVDDHTQAGNKLAAALEASKTGLQPEEHLDAKHQKMVDKLEGLSADDFNNKYISMQTDAHKEAVSLFSSYAKNGDDPKLKRFATDTLPTLKEHLKEVKELKSDYKKEADNEEH